MAGRPGCELTQAASVSLAPVSAPPTGEPVVIAGREPCGYWSATPPPAAPVSASVFPVAAVVRAGAAILGEAGLPALFASASCSRHEASAG